MFKKTLLSLAVASTLGLTGCFDSGSNDSNANPSPKYKDSSIDGKTWPVFNPATSQLPLPNDLIFDSEQGDGTFGVADTKPPVTTALNELSGASTVAPAVIQTNGQLDIETVVYGKSVHLIELAYASEDPLRALSISEPPTLGLAVGSSPVLARADVETLDGTSAIRILPLEPLKPKKRYVVLITTDVKDINGDSIIQDPVYANITAAGTAEDPNAGLLSNALAPVRSLVNKLWEPLALAYAQAAGTPIAEDQIALTYSFTTSNDEKALQYIAEPAAWFEDQLESFIKVSAAKQAVAGGAADYATVKATVDGAFTAFPNIPLGDSGKTATEALSSLYGTGAPCEPTVSLGGDAAVDCAAVALASNFAASGVLPTPSPLNRSASDFTLGAPAPVGLVSAVASSTLTALKSSGLAPNDVLAAQGTVKLPYYLGTSGADLVTKSWVADSSLAAALNTAFTGTGLSIPQADPSVSTAVNHIFPFPKKQADVDAPALVLYPASPTIKGVVLFQHGITTDRSTALTIGSAMAANGYVVVAIDQPLHGIAPFTQKEQDDLANVLLTGAGLDVNDTNRAALIAGQLSLGYYQQIATTCNDNGAGLSSDPAVAIQQIMGGACDSVIADSSATMAGLVSIQNTVANAGSTIPGIAPQDGDERHFGFYAAQPSVPSPMTETAGDSGSLFINLTNFLGTRDNLRQSAVDQMNLRASLAGLNLPIDQSNSITIAPTTPVLFVGHSLGTITGAPFIAAVNGDQLGNTISDGTPAGTVPSAFNNIAGAALLTPGGGVVRTLENSQTFAPRILPGLQAAAGLTQGDSGLESYFNIFQAAIDTADPINFADNLADLATPLALVEAPNDTVIPNSADPVWGGSPLKGNFKTESGGNITIDSFNAPLAGTQPLALTGTAVTTIPAGTHSGPVDPQDAGFAAFVQQTLTLLGTVAP
ncbi:MULTISPECIES: hypothetical protein [unclassified Marinobacter]|uniref:hypothetical protein n=1 Tax=unclassified Marinobacter TaxID=83889 RepID=UPI00273C1AF8|nr:MULTISPECIES: hypothetical protein [unclassified Marinobacter]MDP4548660.1 hypothetical protein [Marinobacter sp. MDS2]